MIFCLALGLLLAIFLDQKKIRGEGFLRPLYLYPLALSFIVTGTAWKLFLDPRIELRGRLCTIFGWTSFHFDWVVDPRHDDNLLRRDRGNLADFPDLCAGDVPERLCAASTAGILKAAQIDGASTFATYRRHHHSATVRPAFMSALIFSHIWRSSPTTLCFRSQARIPGGAAELPSTFMYSYTFTRNQMGVGSASAVIMLATIAAIMVPYLYSELKEKR